MAITYRLEKGSKLTIQEGDDNFRDLDERAAENADNIALIELAASKIKFGTQTASFGGDSVYSFPHGMGQIPDYVQVCYSDPSFGNLYEARVTLDSSNVNIESDNDFPAGVIKIYWETRILS